MNRLKSKIAFLLIMAGVVGCSHTAPPFEENRTNFVPDDWFEQVSPDLPQTLSWDDFADPVLEGLIDEALENNQGILSAVESIVLSRLSLRDSQLQQVPNFNASTQAGYTDSRRGDGVESYGLNASASYEVDLWGQIRDQVELSELNLASTELSLFTTRISLAAEVASTYVALRSLDEIIRLQEQSLTNTEKVKEFVVARYNAGLISGVDVDQQDVRLLSLRSAIEDLKAQRAAQKRRLAILLGRAPGAITFTPQPIDYTLPRLAPGTPISVLTGRPDVLQAEIQLTSAYINIAQARRAFLPALTLNANSGYASANLSELFEDSALNWTAGANLAVTLLDNGARQRNVRRAEINAYQSVLQYQSTILSALEEVESALTAQETNIRQTEIQKAQLEAQERITRETQLRYRTGSVSALDLIQQQESLLGTQQAIVNNWQAGMNSTISLLRALAVAP